MGAEIYRIAIIGIFVTAAATLLALIWIPAPYGRHGRSGWGIALDPRWAWILMESPSFLVMAAMALAGTSLGGASKGGGALAWLFLSLWELHYAYQSFAYPFLIRRSEKHPFPLALIAMAILYNSANAYVNGWWLFASAHRYGPSWTADPRFVAGLALFALGAIAHVDSDRILRNLRAPGESGYKIPSGGLFRFVSCPNYLGEILEWSGFALATWSVAGLSFAAFTLANLLPRALSNHRWYQKTFPEYPEDRRALVPFLL